jgi:predicted ATPase/DNA-binding XRE family transcriptional regulator
VGTGSRGGMVDRSRSAFGVALRRHRLAAGLTQAALAERAGLKERTLSDLERGERTRPYRDTVARLVSGLALPPVDAAALEHLADAQRGRQPRVADGGVPGPRPLPHPPTVLLGRDADVAAVVGLYADPAARLVTLVGPGGVGKTRLALAAAAHPAIAAARTPVFVDLAPLRDPTLVLPTIAGALGLRGRAAVPRAALVAVLRDRPLLLLLDNCEQVADAAGDVAALLAACPPLAVLATSRAALRVRGECPYPVAPLALPAGDAPGLAAARAAPAVALFAGAARAALPGFRLDAGNVAAIVALCRRLDGLPLALELVASRVALLPPAALLADFAAATSGAGPRDLPPRQRTLHAALAWSYDLLDPAARALFRRASAFAGDADLAALAMVGAGAMVGADAGRCPGAFLDTLAALVELHLLERHPDGPDGAPRYGMLATVRDFAAAALAASGEGAATAARHAAYFLALAEAAAPAVARGEPVAIATLAAARDDMRAALRHAQATDDAATALRLANALRFWWYRRGALVEGRRWFAAALRLPSAATAAGRAAALRGAGLLATDAGDLAAAAHLLKAAVAALPPGSADRVPLFQELAIVARRQGHFARARLLIARGRRAALRHGDAPGLLGAAISRAFELRARGELVAAERAFAAALAQARPLGATRELIIALNHLGALATVAGASGCPRRWHGEALTLARRAGDVRGEAWALTRLGDLTARAGEAGAAADLLRALALQEAAGDILATIALTHDLVLLAAARGEAAWAARLAGAERALRAQTTLEDPARDRAGHRAALVAVGRMSDPMTWVAAWRAGQETSHATIGPLLRAYVAQLDAHAAGDADTAAAE